MTDPEFIMLGTEKVPRDNSSWAIDRYVDGAWARWSTSRLEEWHIWRYSMARSIPERRDVAPSKELLDRAEGLRVPMVNLEERYPDGRNVDPDRLMAAFMPDPSKKCPTCGKVMEDDDLELTTQMAAAILGVSRPFVCKLIDEGQLPARRVGKHRRIRWGDFNTFQRVWDAERSAAAAELSALSQELESEK